MELALRKLPDRISFNKEKKLYCIFTGLRTFYFPRKRRVLLYAKGLEKRLSSLEKNYFLDELVLQENDYFVDCGANVGEVSMAVSLRSKCKILVVEPEKLEFECLELNLPACRTNFYHGVLSNIDGEVDFYSLPNSADSSIIQPRKNLTATTMKSWTLDYIFETVEFTGVICLKLEAEGAEPEVLAGSRKILDRISFVSYDASPERGLDQVSTQQEVNGILFEKGFMVIKINPGRFVLFAK